MASEEYNPLTAYHHDLTRGLYPHVDCLVEKFSRLSLISKDELANIQTQEKQVKYLLDKVHDRKAKQNDSKCFDELIKFMKGSQDAILLELADKMSISQDDDAVPCVQAEQSESSATENFVPTTAVLETPQYVHQKSQALVTSNLSSVSNTATNVTEYTVVYEQLWRVECRKSSEDELKLALKFFHSVGALFYFHSIKGMDNFIVTDVCWIFDNLKHLHNTKDSTYQYDYNAKLVLKHEGELMSSMIEEIKCDHLGKVKLKDFVNLLEYLKFIAPLLITFSSGSLHRSVFCYLVAHISGNLPHNWSKPTFDEGRKRQHTFKDLTTFCVNANNYVCHVCILDKIFFLEIRIYSNSKNDFPAVLHHTIFDFIEKSLKIVCVNLKLPLNDYKYGFLCCKCDCEVNQHLMVIKNSDDMTSAYCSKTDELEVLNKNQTMWFYKRSSSIHLHEQATADSDDATLDGNVSYTNGPNDSFKSAEEASTTTHNPDTQSLTIGSLRKSSQAQTSTSVSPALKHLQVFRKYIGDNWFDLGVELLDDCDRGDLDTIKQNFPLNAKRCCTEMFQLWLSRCTSASWDDFIYALQAIELFYVADIVSEFYESNLRYSTPVDNYDRSGHQYNNKTTPVDVYGDHRHHRNSVGNMATGEAMVLRKKRLDSICELKFPKKK